MSLRFCCCLIVPPLNDDLWGSPYLQSKWQHTLEKSLLSGQLFNHSWAQQDSNSLGKIVKSTFKVIIVSLTSTAKYRDRASMQFTKKQKQGRQTNHKNVSFMPLLESKYVLQHTQYAPICKRNQTGEVCICSYKVIIYQSFITIFYFCSGYVKKKDLYSKIRWVILCIFFQFELQCNLEQVSCRGAITNHWQCVVTKGLTWRVQLEARKTLVGRFQELDS